MISLTDDEWSLQILMQLRDLGRNALAGRAVCRDHIFNNSMEYHNVSTFYMTIVVLNLGNIIRQPWFANNKKFPSDIRKVPEKLRENLVLPYLVVNNPGHIITLCEFFGFSLFRNLCIEYIVIGIHCMTRKRRASPPIAIFVKSTHGMVEVLHHWDMSKETGSQTDGWVLHAVIARCIFGPKTHHIDEYTRERTESRYTGEDVTSYSFYGEDRYCTHGLKNITTEEDQLDDAEETYDNVARGSYYATSGLSDQYVQRLGLSEIRVLNLHINSYSFYHSINKIRQYLRIIFAKALLSQVDFITEDFNLFCNRQCSTDLGGSMYGGIALEVLEDVVKETNKHLLHNITYTVSISTPAKEVFEFMQHGNINVNLDCMLCISVFYNKQLSEPERPPILIRARALAHDYLHDLLERSRQLSNYDICLRQTDCDSHRPLIVRMHAFHMRNLRTRGPISQQNRHAAARKRKERYEQGTCGRSIVERTLVHIHDLQGDIFQDGTVESID